MDMVVGGWPTPLNDILWNILVNDDFSQLNGNIINVPNHQPVQYWFTSQKNQPPNRSVSVWTEHGQENSPFEGPNFNVGKASKNQVSSAPWPRAMSFPHGYSIFFDCGEWTFKSQKKHNKISIEMSDFWSVRIIWPKCSPSIFPQEKLVQALTAPSARNQFTKNKTSGKRCKVHICVCIYVSVSKEKSHE